MKYINYLNLLLIPGVYALTFAPIPFPLLISLIATLTILSCVVTTVNQIRISKKINKKNKDINQARIEKAEIFNEKETLRSEFLASSKAQAYQSLKETNQTYLGIIEEQSKEVRNMKVDIERLYETLTQLKVSRSINNFTDTLDGLPDLFKDEHFEEQRRRKSSLAVHRKRLGIEKEEDFTRSF